MSIKISVQSFVVAVGLLVGLNACAGLDFSSTEQEILPPPATVTATALTNTKIQVSWSAVPGAFKYFVFQSQAGGPFLFAGTTLAPDTSRTVINLQPNTLYSYRITARSTGGNQGSVRAAESNYVALPPSH